MASISTLGKKTCQLCRRQFSTTHHKHTTKMLSVLEWVRDNMHEVLRSLTATSVQYIHRMYTWTTAKKCINSLYINCCQLQTLTMQGI